MERVQSSDVFDATHEVCVGFRAMVLGYFRRTGPNTWDDYEFVRRGVGGGRAPVTSQLNADVEVVEVLSLVAVQLESRGVDVRMRSEGRVIRARYVPTEADVEFVSKSIGHTFDPKVDSRALRQHFIDRCLRALGENTPRGCSAVIAGKLNEK